MNENFADFSDAQKKHIHTDNAHKTCSLFFSWDALFYHTFYVSLYLLVFRLFFTFLYAFTLSQQWHIEKVWGWFPIVAFNSDLDTFTNMNSYAVITAGIAVVGCFVFQCFARYQQQRQYKIYAWYCGVLMLLLQYAILMAINARIRFAIHTNLWVIFVGLIVFATILLYIWYHYVKQWKFQQHIRAEEKYEKKLKNKEK